MSNLYVDQAKKALAELVSTSKSANLAIEYAITLDANACKAFLQLWHIGDFALIKKHFKNVPTGVFYGDKDAAK